jgi:gamma-butyrobetaine dioxygenase
MQTATVTIDLDRRWTIVDHPLTPQPLPHQWLRHHCHCPQCVHPSGQRLLDAATIAPDVHPASATLEADELEVVWSTDHHRSRYRLAELSSPRPPTREAPELWDASITPRMPTADHAALCSQPHVMLDWLVGVDRLGFGVLRGVPVSDGEVARVAELFAHVRTTNYGRCFDVRAVVDPTNLANSSLGLPAHTDNPYRDPVPTLQLLHCLQSSAGGGDNVLVDGFRVAAEVRAARPEGFALLASRPVDFVYADDDAELRASAPLVELDPSGKVRAVRCNSRSMAPPDMADDELVAWYDAFSLWCRMLDDPQLQVRIHLEPGDLFIVDNRRVLHGRTAYDSSGGTRHLQGCYADIDGLRSSIAVLRRRLLHTGEAPR